MKKINLFHIGPGKVGKKLIAQIAARKQDLKSKFGVDILYKAIIGKHSSVTSKRGFSTEELHTFSERGIDKYHLPTIQTKDVLKSLYKENEYNVLIDTSDSETTVPVMLVMLKAGGYVVTSNKNPLSTRLADFNSLWKYKSRIFFETTVGAGLPVITTLKNLILSGDEIIDVRGCFSGTLGYIFSMIENGSLFSLSVTEAFKKGYTEPHPKDDLSGKDIARKALIINRLLGGRKEINDIKPQKLYGKELETLSPENFISSLKRYDTRFRKASASAALRNVTMRYTATVTNSKIKIGVSNVPKTGDLGALNGPDNMIVIKTKQYRNHPIVIKGPGAGSEVTATGVFGDILSLAGII